MENPYSTYIDKICTNCINNECNKQFVVIEKDNMKTLKCINYIKPDNLKGYIKPLCREAKQLRSLMGFHQEY